MASIWDFFGVNIDKPDKDPVQVEAQNIAFARFKKAVAEEEDLTPFVLGALGLVDDPESGKIRNMTSDEFFNSLDEVGQKNYTNLNLMLDRQNRALKGELPESEALAQRKQESFDLAKQSLAERGHTIEGDTLDNAVGLSTPAVQTLAKLKEEFGLRSDVERRDIIKTGNAGILQNMGVTSDLQNRDLVQLSSLPNRGSSVLSGSSQIQQPYQYDSSLNTQINSANAQTNADALGLAGVAGYGILRKLLK